MLDKNPDVKKPDKIKKAGLHAANATFPFGNKFGTVTTSRKCAC